MIYTDYASMQKAAQRRVYDMQQRSKRALADAPEERSDTCPDKHNEETEPIECKSKEPCSKTALSGDRLLIAVLIAILISEGKDLRTVAALLYLLM